MVEKDDNQATPIEDEKLDEAVGAGGQAPAPGGTTTQSGDPRAPTNADFVKDAYNDVLGRDTSSTQTVGTTKPTVKP